MNPSPFISIDRVTKTYASRSGLANAVLETTVRIEQGEFVCIVGPSGCGKTTLMNMVAGFVTPSGGEVSVDGRQVSEPGPDRGVVFQEVGLFAWLTARRNVEFGLKMMGIPKSERTRRADEALALTNMSAFADRYPSELSGGMKQRVGLARVLATDPHVLLMDEPFGALDAQTRAIMQQELLRVWTGSGKTVIFITHAVDEAVLLADRVLVMTANPGRVKADIRVDLPRPRDENSSEFNALERELKEMVLQEARAAQVAA